MSYRVKRTTINQPTKCKKCGTTVIEVSLCNKNRQWECSCFWCGIIWWVDRIKYKHAHLGDED